MFSHILPRVALDILTDRCPAATIRGTQGGNAMPRARARRRRSTARPTLTRRQVRRYGWVPDLPDQRDFIFAAPEPRRALPPLVDLRPQCPVVYDQGELGSCTAN